MEKVKKILMISTITVVFAIMPVFGAKKQGVTIYKQSDLVKQQVNIYTLRHINAVMLYVRVWG